MTSWRILCVSLSIFGALTCRPLAAERALIALCGAYPPELKALRAEFQADEDHGFTRSEIRGVEFWRGTVKGRDVLLFRTGTSIVNATYQLQVALDHFPVTQVLFAGVAGGVDPRLHIGDVVIPERWAYHDEAIYVNEDENGGFVESKYLAPGSPHFGMIFPIPVKARNAGESEAGEKAFFSADASLLAVARGVLPSLPPQQKAGRSIVVEVGGTGVSGSVFLDNAKYRDWLFATWEARCVDMESTALAHVAAANGKPILIVRGLSDLAGKQEGHNPIKANEASVAEIAAKVLRGIVEAMPAEAK